MLKKKRKIEGLERPWKRDRDASLNKVVGIYN